jgi:hypothetical protein
MKPIDPQFSFKKAIQSILLTKDYKKHSELFEKYPKIADFVQVKHRLSGVQSNLPIVALMGIYKYKIVDGNSLWVGKLKHVGKSISHLKLNLMRSIANKGLKAGITLLALGIVGIGIVALATRKKNIRSVQNTFVKGSIVLEDDANADVLTCIVCYERKRCIYFRPCGHLVTCGVCFEAMKDQNKKCIVCKREVQSWKIIKIAV